MGGLNKKRTNQAQKKEPSLQVVSGVLRKVRKKVNKVLRYDKLRSIVLKYVEQGNLLDVGCGYGGRLKPYFSSRYVPWGIEISRALAASANELFSNHGGSCINSDALSGLEQLNSEFFDGIIMRSYLEHELAPREVCYKCLRVLRPGGVLIVKVPNYASWNRFFRGRRWCGYRFPDHLNYFTPESLVGLLKSLGYEIARFGVFDRIPTSDNMWLVARKSL